MVLNNVYCTISNTIFFTYLLIIFIEKFWYQTYQIHRPWNLDTKIQLWEIISYVCIMIKITSHTLYFVSILWCHHFYPILTHTTKYLILYHLLLNVAKLTSKNLQRIEIYIYNVKITLIINECAIKWTFYFEKNNGEVIYYCKLPSISQWQTKITIKICKLVSNKIIIKLSEFSMM